MWRSSSISRLLLRTVLRGSPAISRCACAGHLPRPRDDLFSASAPTVPSLPIPPPTFSYSAATTAFASASAASAAPEPHTSSPLSGTPPDERAITESLSFCEAKKLLRLVNVEALKRRLGTDGEEVIGVDELVEACLQMGLAKSQEEARQFTRVLDEAGVVLLFRDKVYLHPDKVVDLMKKAVPLALTPEDDPRREELTHLVKKKEEIDMLAHKQVRRILWSGLGFFIAQVGLFFRLTFWEFSWDVMEPIAFFTTTTGILVGYAYFLFTSRDPTYQDLMKRLFLSRQRKLYQKHCFDVDRFTELQKQCKCPLDEHRRLGMGDSHRD